MKLSSCYDKSLAITFLSLPKILPYPFHILYILLPRSAPAVSLNLTEPVADSQIESNSQLH